MINENATLKELSKFVDIDQVSNYRIKALTKHSTIESFDYKKTPHENVKMRCNRHCFGKG